MVEFASTTVVSALSAIKNEFDLFLEEWDVVLAVPVKTYANL